MSPFESRCCTVALAGLLCTAAAPRVAVAQSPQSPQAHQAALAPAGFAVPTEPARRGVPRPGPEPPPELPVGADALEPDTWRVQARSGARGGRSADVVQTVSRTANRVHVALAGGDEWLFERNPVDPRRVSGFAILHASRVIVAYSDSDLRNLLRLTGWAQVITFGCRMADLAPASCAARDGRSQLTLTRLRGGVDPRLLAPAAARFPAYREVDVADWLEEH